MNVIRSQKHEIFTETIKKVAFSSEDDKSIICEDKIHTLANGHYKIKSGGNCMSSGTT